MRNHPSHSRVRQVKEIIHEIHKQRPRLAILGNEGTNNADPAYGLLIFSPAGRKAVLARAAPKKQKMMWEALREATDEEMEKDPTVCVIGAAPPVSCQSIVTALLLPPTITSTPPVQRIEDLPRHQTSA